MKNIVAILILILLHSGVPFDLIGRQEPHIISGPMVNHADMNHVVLWMQVSDNADCAIEYYEVQKPEKSWLIKGSIPDSKYGNVMHFIADSVQPGKKYDYAVIINGVKQTFSYPLQFQVPALWQWRTDPPDVSIALGSCFYVNETEYDRPGKPYGGDYSIVNEIANKKPDIMLWLGDNVYYREVDWTSHQGMLHRNTHTRAIPELQPLLGSAHNYAIWDDHDFGPNDSDRGFVNKELAREMFMKFWGNPSYGKHEEGIYTTFQWSDIQFILLDNRYFRSPDKRKSGERTILGKDQKEWLIDNLVSSSAKFKIIAMGGQFANPVQKFENYAMYEEERKEIIQLLAQENINGVIFLSGDRHYSEFSEIPASETGMKYPLIDFTVSPLTSGPFKSATAEDKNKYASPGSEYFERNFGMIYCKGKGSDRTLEFILFDKSGKEVWKKAISAQQLGYSK